MSLRGRAAAGALLLAGGLLGMLGAASFNQPVMLGVSAILAVAGLLAIVLALRAAARQIDEMHRRFDALLRAEIPPDKRPPGPPP